MQFMMLIKYVLELSIKLSIKSLRVVAKIDKENTT